MRTQRIHLLLPPCNWTAQGYTWCLRQYPGDISGKPVTTRPAAVTCPVCLKAYTAAQSGTGHPLQGYLELTMLQKQVCLRTPASVARFAQTLIRERQQVTWCLMATQRFRLFHVEMLFRGHLEEIVWHPREILRPVLRYAAFGFILVQNHPSGDPRPEPEEEARTRQLVEASAFMGIQFLDHIIVGLEGFYSLRAKTGIWDEPFKQEW